MDCVRRPGRLSGSDSAASCLQGRDSGLLRDSHESNPWFSYELLWSERSINLVANLTRVDCEEFLELAPRIPIRTKIEVFPLEHANEALDFLRTGTIRGAGVLVP